MQIWSIIVQSNTFNFLIMVIIFAVIFKKCKVSDMLSNSIENVKKTISKAQSAKEKSVDELNYANKEVEKIPSDLEKIELQGKKNIELSTLKLQKDVQFELENIKSNTKRAIETKNSDIISNLSTSAIIASSEIARRHFIKLFEKDPSLHQKLIYESIDEIDKELKEIRL